MSKARALKWQKKLSWLLRPFGRAYASLMRARAGAYRHGLLPSVLPAVVTVAVGNIGWGGSGKTPLADWILDWAKDKGLTAALLSRGYGGKSKERPVRVRPDSDSAVCGDEPLMLVRRHPEARILADPSRRRALRALLQEGAPDLLVLDDAMQHLAVRRDLNLVLLRPEDLLDEWNKVIPAGSWREDARALKRADAFLLRADEEAFAVLSNAAMARCKAYHVPVFTFDLAPNRLTSIGRGDGEAAPAEALGPNYILCSAVGSPDSVERSARQFFGRPPHAHFRFPDHHPFSAADVERLFAYGLPLVCTGKDAVKLARFAGRPDAPPMYELGARLTFGPALFSQQPFADWFEAKCLEARRRL